MDFRRREVPRVFVLGQTKVRELEIPARELFRLSALHVGHIQVIETIALGQEIDALVVGQEAVGETVTPTTAGPKPADPGVVVLVYDGPRRSRCQVEKQQPRVLVVRPTPPRQQLWFHLRTRSAH